MARRYSTKNAAMGIATLFSVAHGLGATPDEWALNLRWVTGYRQGANGAARAPTNYISGISSSNIRVRVASATAGAHATPTGDLFAWRNHSIVK